MRVKTLELFLFLLLLAPGQCKLILSTDPSKPVHPYQSYAQILNTSLQRFDNFTLCGRYRIIHYIIQDIMNHQSSGISLKFNAVRFITFNFVVEFEKKRYLDQYIFSYGMNFLGNYTFNLQ